MRLPERKILEIEAAREAVFQAAQSFSHDRLDWRPMDRGQSVLDIVRELARTPDWAYWVLTDAKLDDPDGAAEAQRREREAWRTVDDCDEACGRKLEQLFDLYRSLSDADLARTRWLTFNGGRDHTVAELLDYPRWNFAYHHGQIDYVRSLIDLKRDSCVFLGPRR